MYHKLRGKCDSGFLMLTLLAVGCGGSAPTIGIPATRSDRPVQHPRHLSDLTTIAEDDRLLHQTRDSLAEVTVDLTLAQERHEHLVQEIAAMEQKREHLRPLGPGAPASDLKAVSPAHRPTFPSTVQRSPRALSDPHSSFEVANRSNPSSPRRPITASVPVRRGQNPPLHSVTDGSAGAAWSRLAPSRPEPNGTVQRIPPGSVVIPLAHGVLIGVPGRAAAPSEFRYVRPAPDGFPRGN